MRKEIKYQKIVPELVEPLDMKSLCDACAYDWLA